MTREPEPCIECGENMTTALLCTDCRVARATAKAEAAQSRNDEAVANSKARLRAERTRWLNELAAERGCRKCGTHDAAVLMWRPIPTYDGPSIATMLNRSYGTKRFEEALRYHVATCWNHFFAAVDPQALYPTSLL